MSLVAPNKPVDEISAVATTNRPAPSNNAQAKKPENRKKKSRDASNGNIQFIVEDLAEAVEGAVYEIHEVNAKAKILALNARIEAARAGQYGAAFGVVASEMQSLSQTITEVANSMSQTTNSTIDRLLHLLGNNVLGNRLSDVARTNIDLVDRNLYERTCDVRWWATDSSLTSALESLSPDLLEHASSRMGVILGAYTVYFDLVLCNREGIVVANGRPDQYDSVGKNVSRAPWFARAMVSRSGDEFSFESAHASDLVNHQQSLIYSCAVRENGASQGEPLGVLGVVFDWNGLANPILNSLASTVEESKEAMCLFIDRNGSQLASSSTNEGKVVPSTEDMQKVFASPKGYFVSKRGGRNYCFAHAKAPGFETYSTGWYSVVIQPTF